MKFGGTSVATGRPHPQRRPPRRPRGAGRLRGGGRRLGDVGMTNEWWPGAKDASPLLPSPNTTRSSPRRAGHLGLLAIVLAEMGIKARSWQGWQIPIETSDQHGSARIQNIDGARLDAGFQRGEVGGDRRLPGHPPRDRPPDHPRARRLRHQRGRDRGGGRCRARCDIYTDVDGVYTARPPGGAEGPAARAGGLRGDARDGLPRGQGAPGALGRARHGAPGADHRALLLRRPRRRPPRHLICDEDDIVEQQIITGIASRRTRRKSRFAG